MKNAWAWVTTLSFIAWTQAAALLENRGQAWSVPLLAATTITAITLTILKTRKTRK